MSALEKKMQMEGNHQLPGLVSAVVTLSQSEDGFHEDKTDCRPGHWASGFSEDYPSLPRPGNCRVRGRQPINHASNQSAHDLRGSACSGFSSLHNTTGDRQKASVIWGLSCPRIKGFEPTVNVTQQTCSASLGPHSCGTCLLA